jgi:uncharacterized protein (DUF433 family)
MSAQIIDRGRGPEIAGTRITVYNILDMLPLGWDEARLADFYRLTTEELRAALDYIEAHREEILPIYEEGLARAARGNPPEVEANLAASRQKLLAFREALRQRNNGHAGPDGGR